MRQLLLLLFAILCTCVRAQSVGEAEIPVSSTIATATVYREGAQVSRQASVPVPEGRTALIFTGLTSSLDPASVQLRLVNSPVMLLSVSHRIHFDELPERNAAQDSIYDRIDRLEDRRRELQARVAIAKEEEELLRANRDLAGTANGLTATDLERGVTFHRERITAIKLSYLALGDSLRANEQARNSLQEELADIELQRQRPATSEVIAIVESKAVALVQFDLSYLVAEAGWKPEYDVRVADISQPIDLRYRARVHQHSGEDWQDVRLTLSTGDPSASATAPELLAWRIRPGQLPPVYGKQEVPPAANSIRRVRGTVVDEENAALIGATVLIEGTEIGTVTDLDGRFSLEVPESAERVVVSYTGYESIRVQITGEELTIILQAGDQLDEVVVVGYEVTGVLAGRASGVNIRRRNRSEQKEEPQMAPVPTQTLRKATTVNFVIELPYTIPSDGKPRSVEIKQYAVPAVYHHLAVPKRDEDVYLSAVIRDWEKYDLISGDLQLFFEGTYLGTSRLEVEKTADSLLLSLGRDPSVVVTRRPNEEFRAAGGFFSGKQVDSRGWTIAVRNTKAQPISLTILDQVPVAADSRLEVELTLPEHTKLDEQFGRLTWELTLPPASERKFDFGYAVKYPSGERVYVE